MSLFVRERSRAWRVRIGNELVEERYGKLHRCDTMLEWGSITKTVTAAIAQNLAESGTIDRHAPISAYLPVTDIPEHVDVNSLIEHESGLRRMPSEAVVGRYASNDPFAKFTTEFFDERIVPELARELTGKVGKHDYSNLGYAVLTRILEAATGRTWWELARALVLEPMGVTDVGIDPTAPRVPVLHTWRGGPRTHWTLNRGPFIGAGGLVGTLEALESYALESVQRAPRRGGGLAGWPHIRGYWWHNGQVRDHGAWVGVDDAAHRAITVHAIGHLYLAADVTAARLQRKYRYRGE